MGKPVALIPASVKRAVDTLMEKDFIYQDKDGYYRVLDPAMLTYLKEITFFEFNKR
jgi:DNA-binding IclR family transcriptional regulator